MQRKELYTKLFHRILNSSIWDEDDATRIVWITMLALVGEDGVVITTTKSLARNARVSVDHVEKALQKFLSPDPESLTSEYEGRRVEKVDGGYRLLNHKKYKLIMSLEHRREYARLKKQEARDLLKNLNQGLTAREMALKNLNQSDQMHDHPETEPYHTPNQTV